MNRVPWPKSWYSTTRRLRSTGPCRSLSSYARNRSICLSTAPGQSTPQRCARPAVHHEGWAVRAGRRIVLLRCAIPRDLVLLRPREPLAITIVVIKFPVNTSRPRVIPGYFPRINFRSWGRSTAEDPPLHRLLAGRARGRWRRHGGRSRHQERTGRGGAFRSYAGSSRSSWPGRHGGVMCCGMILPERRPAVWRPPDGPPPQNASQLGRSHGAAPTAVPELCR